MGVLYISYSVVGNQQCQSICETDLLLGMHCDLWVVTSKSGMALSCLLNMISLENGRLLDRHRIRTDTGHIISNRIGYYCIGRYYVHHCRFINCWRIALHMMIKGRSREPSPAHRARTRAVLFYGPWYGRGLERREAEGDCNLIWASPWHKDRAVLVLATITPHSLHQQEVIITVSCQSL